MTVAREHLSNVEKYGTKKAMLLTWKKWGASRSSVYEYVKELRGR